MKIKRLMIGYVIIIFSAILMTTLVTATTFPSYNNETDCRGCHGGDVSHRHHLLAVNGTFQCTDCHPIQFDNITQTYSTQVIRNCLTCHVGKNHTNVHHILASQGLFVCSDCHPVIFDNVTQTYSTQVTWDCTVCHSTVFSIQNEIPTPTPTPTPTPIPHNVTLTNFTPSSPVTNFVGDSRDFHVIIDQVVDITWSMNGTQVQSNGSISDAGYTNTSAALGTWNVSATASNIYGNVTYTWEWIVIYPPPPPVTPSINSYFPLFSPVNDSVGSSRKFGISIDQNVDIQWLINEEPVQFNGSINGSSYKNTSAVLGSWNVSAIVSNINGTDIHSWIWNVKQVVRSITVTSPNGGENWKRNTIHAITWTNVGNPGIKLKSELLKGTSVVSTLAGTYVKIELLKGSTVVSTLANNAPNNGSYSWKISSSQSTATNYKIRITSIGNPLSTISYTDKSDNYFQISK